MINEHPNRKSSFDLIRVFAIFLVLFTHTGTEGSKLYTIGTSTLNIKTFLYIFLDCFRTINNPLLFMISGALLLGKEEPFKTVVTKRIVRFTIVLLVFSYIKVLSSCYLSGTLHSFNALSTLKDIISSPVQTSYWYLYSYISFLIMLPLLRLMVRNMQVKDGLYLFFIGVLVLDGFRIIRTAFNISHINLTIYFSEMILFYPLIGFLLENKCTEKINSLSKRSFVILGSLALLGVCISALATYHEFLRTQSWSETWIVLFDPFLAAFFFIFFRFVGETISGNSRLSSLIYIASDSMFGIYLCENYFKKITKPVFYLMKSYIPTLFACIIWLICTMILGIIVISVIKKIPGVRKFI